MNPAWAIDLLSGVGFLKSSRPYAHAMCASAPQAVSPSTYPLKTPGAPRGAPGSVGAELLVPQHFQGTHAHSSISHQGRRDHRQERGTCGQYDDHPPADAKTGFEEEIPQRDHR